jgi:hypothetical protein
MTGKLMAPRRLLPLVATLLTFAAARAEAQTWVDWTAVSPGNPGSAKGNLPLGTGNVGVTYNGEVEPLSHISNGTSAGTPFDPAAFPVAFTSPTAPNGPSNNGWIQLIGPSQGNVLTFDSPIDRLFFAFISLGQAGLRVSYVFDQPFTILSQGPGNWGGCTTTCTLQTAPNIVTGEEGNGVLMFDGPITSLGFSVVGSEDYHGFTIAADVTTTPEPASLALLGTGLIGVFGAARIRRKKNDDA